MKNRAILFVAVFASATMLAQTTSSQSGGATNAHGQHHAATAAPAQSGTTGQGSGMQMGGQAGMREHMAGMQADMQQMRTQVDKMRADAQKVKDPDTRAALQENAAMWQQFLDRMQHHMQMMGQGITGRHGMMEHGADKGCAGHRPAEAAE